MRAFLRPYLPALLATAATVAAPSVFADASISPSLPAYAHVTQEAVQCAAKAALRYDVPELLLHAILRKENGRVGKASRNKNGSYDLGPAQINTSQLQTFSKFGLSAEHIQNDFCTNIYVSAYILRDNFNKKDADWFKAIVAYNIGPNKWTPERYSIGYRYARDVVQYWWGFQNYVDAQRGVQRTSQVAPSTSTKRDTHSSSNRQLVFSVVNDDVTASVN